MSEAVWEKAAHTGCEITGVWDTSDLPDAVWPSASWPLWGWKPVLHMLPMDISKLAASGLALCLLSAVWIACLLVIPLIS